MKKTVNRTLAVLLAVISVCAVTFSQPVCLAAGITISCASTAKKNSINTIKVKGKKRTNYYIRVKCPKGSWSTSKTVCKSNYCKKTNSSGVASWAFKVGQGSTSKGTYTIYIYSDKAHKHKLASKTFRVK